MKSIWTRRPYQVERYDTPWLRAAVGEKLTTFRPDVVHVDYLHQAPLAWDLSLPKVLDLHNVESVLSAGIGASSGGFTGFMARRDARLLKAVEHRAAERFQLVTAPSANEAARMPGNVEVVVNGVDPSRQPLGVTPDPDLICFVGIFSWVPNVDGAVWFVEKVLPLLPARFRVQLVGRNPHRRVLALAGPRVEVTGEVADTWPYVSRAAVVLAPLLTPGGTRHKILEGLLAERCVVATPQAADGLSDLAGSGLVLADSPDAFARSIVELAENPAKAAQLGREGRSAVIQRYSWEASCTKMLQLYETHLGVT